MSVSGPSELEAQCRRTLARNWREGVRDGVAYAYTAPSTDRYPWQWYWDSCFAAIARRRFDRARARLELETLLASLDDRRRQDLYAWAARAVGTRATFTVELRRIERCLAWAEETRRSQHWLVRAFRLGGSSLEQVGAAEAAALAAVKAIGRHTDQTHVRAMGLLAELCTIGSTTGEPSLVVPLPGRAPRGRRSSPAR